MIRKATLPDVGVIHSLLAPRAQAGTVLPRSPEDIEANLRDFFVYEREGRVIGTCSLVNMGEKLAEVRSLVVDSEFGRKGIGSTLIQACIDDALELGYGRIFALTYIVPVFVKLGFHVATMSELPYKVWKDCQTCYKQNNCDETAVIRDLVTVKVDDLPRVLRDADSDPAISIEDFS